MIAVLARTINGLFASLVEGLVPLELSRTLARFLLVRAVQADAPRVPSHCARVLVATGSDRADDVTAVGSGYRCPTTISSRLVCGVPWEKGGGESGPRASRWAYTFGAAAQGSGRLICEGGTMGSRRPA